MEEILMSGATGILKRLVGVVSKDFASAWDVKDDLKKLQSSSEIILAVIADAEKRQEKEELVRLWLRRLKDIAYDADDVIDEFSYEDMGRRDREDSSKHKVISLPTSSNPSLKFRLKMAKKIQEINQRLDIITKDMGRFQLEVIVPDGESTKQLDRQYTSHVNESEIVGREYDESHIIKLLTTNTTYSSASSYSENISVISIVGMGGLGKTTLAQLAYKDELVKKVFKPLLWVHVSEIFDIEIILVNIMESITQTKFHKPSNLHVLVNIVREELNGKKYMLVLDDLWNEDSEQWGSLMAVLLVGAPGSRILITTRDDRVASVVRGSIPPYSLNPLQDDACWSIIKQKAFAPGGASDAPKMTDVGKEIAKKCCGLPLAAKFLGGLMRLKVKESDWISIRDDDIWNTPESKRRILPVLKLSYNYLPSHLKQCFSYCSIFPKNWEINKETLVHLWMAEGFLKQHDVKNKRATEDFARDYFESLAWSSFFQDFKKNVLGDIETCKMHDLVHDLAKDVVGENEFVSLKACECDVKNVSQVRRLRLEWDEEISAASLKGLRNAKKLRTIFFPQGSKLDPGIFSSNEHIRVLHVDRSPNLTFLKLSSLSFKLRHLRYLHLTCLDLREAATVNGTSIGKLYNLETLVLNNMYGVQSLLTNIHCLQKLRCLEVSFTDMVQLPDSVTSLCNLQTLDLHNSGLEVVPDSISGLKNLRFLNLSSNPIEELPVSVLALSNLETLDINSCRILKSLPEYVAGLAKLRIFYFRNCPLLEALPEDIGALTQLRYLSLDDTQIEVLPESCANLNNLEYVDLFWCELPRDVKNWTNLTRFNYRRLEPISGIGKLIFLKVLAYMVPQKLINESEGNVGIEELADLNFLEVLDINGVQNVRDPIDVQGANFKGKQNLRTLTLRWVEEVGLISWGPKSCNFQVFQALQPPTCLKELHIHNFMGWELPTWMCVSSGLPQLVRLELVNCKGIKQLAAGIRNLPRLRFLKLQGLSSESLDIGGFPCLDQLFLKNMFLLVELSFSSYPSGLQDVAIFGCERLTEIPWCPFLRFLQLENVNHKLVCSVGKSQTSLTKLFLKNIDEFIYFPKGILQNNCNLEVLLVRECNQFEGFGVNDDENGPELYKGSLQTLAFFDCPLLKCLPDLRGWTCLQVLVIFDCPQLKESLTYDLKSISSLNKLYVDFIQRDEHPGEPCDIDHCMNLVKMGHDFVSLCS